MPPSLSRVLVAASSAQATASICGELRSRLPEVEVKTVDSAGLVLATLEDGACDALVVDLGLQEADVAAWIGALRLKYPDIPCVCVGGSIGEEETARLLQSGADDFVHRERLHRLPSCLERLLSGAGRVRTGVSAAQLLEVIDGALWESGPELEDPLYSGPAVETIWGITPEDLRASGQPWPAYVDEEDARVRSEARSLAQKGKPFILEYRIRRADGTFRWIRDSAKARTVGQMGAIRYFGISRDITARRHVEQELLQSQKMELVGRLAGGVAHDFNNLLTIISGYVSMILDRESESPATQDALKRVFTASRQATSLVRQLLLFSRRRTLHREVLDMNAEVELMVTMLRRLLGETILVEYVPCAQSPRVLADVGMMEQVLINLAVNARDAMPKGGKLTIALAERPRGALPESATRSLHHGDFAEVSVSDTGTGIAPTILPRIFEPFFTTKDEGHGTGLGLATVQDIVKRHDGWIDVETQEGQGTTFRVYLPLTSAALASAGEDGPLRGRRPGKTTILLVEDESNVREFAAAVLQQEGYTLLQAKSGEQALEVWKWHEPRIDLLLSDVVLPGDASGPELAKRFQSAKPALRVVLTTGYARDAVPLPQPGKNALHFLGKPYTPKALLRAVEEALL